MLSCTQLLLGSTSRSVQKKDAAESKKQSQLVIALKSFVTPFNITIITLISIGLLLLIIVGVVIWTDITIWQKELTVIFFENRTNQIIGLGIGLQLIHYYISSVILIAMGLSIFTLRNK